MEKIDTSISLSKPIITTAIVNQSAHILRSRQWVQGAYVARLEEQVRNSTKAKYAVAVNSGTAALHTLLSAHTLKPDDEVITSPFTFAATAHAIVLAGAKVVFADISDKDFNLDPEDVKRKITKKTRGILAVDLFGQPAAYKRLAAIAKEKNIFVCGDSAQSIGAFHYQKSPAAYTDGAIYSFYATKNVASAEGGIIVTNNKHIYDFAVSFRNQGKKQFGDPYTYEMIGYNYRLSEIHAVIASEQLAMLDRITAKRVRMAKNYTAGLQALSNSLTLPDVLSHNTHAFHQYTIRVKSGSPLSRDELQKKLLQKGIQTGIYYPQPLHLSSHLQFLGYKKGDFPVAEAASAAVLSLPIHYYLTTKQQQYIIKTLKDILRA